MAALRIGVLGGTFDPPHYGHLALAQHARDQLGLERVLWVPAGDPWRKAEAAVSPSEHRLAMAHLAIAGNEAFQVDAREAGRPGPSYTVETLAELQAESPSDELVFLLGADALMDLPNWHDAARLIQLALLGAVARSGVRPAAATLDALLPGLSARVGWFEMPRMDISASDLRRRAAAGRSLRDLVPPAVEDYIVGHRLYSKA